MICVNSIYLDVENLFDRGALEPRKLGKRQKQLFVTNEHPHTVWRNVSDRYLRSNLSRLR